MTNIFRHIKTLMCVALAVLLTACGGDTPDAPQDPAGEEQGLFLVCNIGMVGQTRAGEAPAIESMQSLRIIVLDDNGAVEYNEHFSFESARDKYYHIIPLKKRSRKRVFIFANEESVAEIKTEPASMGLTGSLHDFLEDQAEGATGFETKVASIYYKPDFSKAIPLNAMYDVEIPDGERFIEKTFWLVRVATKFTFTFINNRRYDDLTIENFEVRGLSDKHFFMPRFTDNVVPTFAGYETWIDWLKDVSDKSQINPDNPTADDAGWLTGYDIPATAQSVTLTYSSPFTLAHPTETGKTGEGKEIPDIYACESKTLRGSGIAREQQYILHVDCTSTLNVPGLEPEQQQRSFETALPNVRALFRNTHPHVIVTINDGSFEINAVVDVVPYRGCILYPYFGLERN